MAESGPRNTMVSMASWAGLEELSYPNGLKTQTAQSVH